MTYHSVHTRLNESGVGKGSGRRSTAVGVPAEQEDILPTVVLGVNDETYGLSKLGRKQEQSAHPVSLNVPKAIMRNNHRTAWRRRPSTETDDFNIQKLDGAAQVAVLRPRI